MSTLWNFKFCEGDIKFDGIKIRTIQCRYLEACYWIPIEKGKYRNPNLNIPSVVIYFCYVMTLFENLDA